MCDENFSLRNSVSPPRLLLCTAGLARCIARLLWKKWRYGLCPDEGVRNCRSRNGGLGRRCGRCYGGCLEDFGIMGGRAGINDGTASRAGRSGRGYRRGYS